MRKLNRAKIIKSLLLNILEKDNLSEKEDIYILLLLLNKYNCLNFLDSNELRDLNKARLYFYLKQAEKKVLMNNEFRTKYFNVEDNINSII